MIAEPTASPQGRTPPHDLEAETSVLGAILLARDAIADVVDVIGPGDFYRENNGAIYGAAVALFRDGEPIDNVTLAAALGKLGVLERVGGRAHLALLQESVPAAANVEHYARIVKAKAEKRALIKAGYASVSLGHDDGVAAGEAVNQAQAQHFALSDRRSSGGFVLLHDLLKPAMDRIDDQANGKASASRGLPTGFPDLDRVLNGLKPGNLILAAGATSMGKTSFALQIATHIAIEQRVPVAIFSLEMSKEELVERMLCEQAQVSSQRLASGTIGDGEFDRLSKALGPLGDAQIWIDDCSSLDDLTFRLGARQAKARHGAELIVVDYLGLMKSRTKGNDPVQEVSAISWALKSVARELNVPVMALSQLSRAPASRPDKRPILSDLRYSGSLEQDSDVVLFVYRDDYYTKEKSEKPGLAEIIVAKQRNGPTGTIELLFRKEYTRFESLERRHAGGDG